MCLLVGELRYLHKEPKGPKSVMHTHTFKERPRKVFSRISSRMRETGDKKVVDAECGKRRGVCIAVM